MGTVYRKGEDMREILFRGKTNNGGKVEIPCADLNNRLIIEKREEE